MRNRYKYKFAAVLLTGVMTASLLSGCGDKTSSSSEDSVTTETSENSSSKIVFAKSEMFTDRDSDASYDASSATAITFSSDAVTCDSEAVTVSDGAVSSDATVESDDTTSGTSSVTKTVTITEEGTYLLSGSSENIQIVVDADSENDKIQLVLDNLTMSCESTAPIYIKSADKVFVTLADGSENGLSVTGEFVQTDDNNVDAAIFSKEDLTLNGSGSLAVTSDYGHGVVSKDDLVVTGGSYVMTCAKHGLSGKDSVRILDGTFDLTTTKDGIHASNDDDATLGYIYIAGGTFTIQADDDGMHADSTLYIEGGDIDIEKSNEGLEGQTITITDGEINIVSSDDGINASSGSSGSTSDEDTFDGEMFEDKSFDNNSSDSNSSNSDSSGGNSSDSSTGDTMPDGNTPPSMPSGNGDNNTDGTTPPSMPSGDGDNKMDGSTPPSMPSDNGDAAGGNASTEDNATTEESTASDSNITSLRTTSLTSSDSESTTEADMNDAKQGGQMTKPDDAQTDRQMPDAAADFGGRGGMGGDMDDFDMDSDESCTLTISGGTITIDADGDGIDTNGYFYMNGGTVYVEGSESDYDSALDYGISATVTGGYFLAIGASGMAENFGSDSTQCVCMATFSSSQSRSTVSITDADGTVLLSYETDKSFDNVIFSCPELATGSTYTLTTGDTTSNIELTDTITESSL